jgi:hypothetical protein
VKSFLPECIQPIFHGGHRDLPQSIMGEHVFFLCLAPEEINNDPGSNPTNGFQLQKPFQPRALGVRAKMLFRHYGSKWLNNKYSAIAK